MLKASRDASLSQELIDGCKKKKVKCQELLYKQFFGYALSIALRYIGDRNKAIEVVDDSFMKVFDKICLYNTNQDFKGWFRIIIINTTIDKLRKEQILTQRERKINGESVLMNDKCDADSGVHFTELYELTSSLPDIHRTVFNLFEIEGFNHREIAQMLDIPESSSRTYLTRAKKRLRDLYKKYFQ